MKLPECIAAVALLGALCGCSATPLGASAGPSTAGPTASDGTTVADPQIFSDVIDWAFPVGGNHMLRTMRLGRAVSSIQVVDCGGKPFENLDYTGDREDQMLYPDLDLIRQKGLTNGDGSRPSGTRMGDDKPCRDKSLPSWRKVFDLNVGYWDDATREVWNSSKTQNLLAATGKCLEEKSGWSLTHGNASKMEYFFVRVDSAAVQAANTSQKLADTVTMKYSIIFAECAGDYASAMQTGLEERRPAAVERNRELLTSLAKELAVAGYVP